MKLLLECPGCFKELEVEPTMPAVKIASYDPQAICDSQEECPHCKTKFVVHTAVTMWRLQ